MKKFSNTLCVSNTFTLLSDLIKVLLNVEKKKNTSKVKKLERLNNQQVTKAFNSLVGTSETIRLLTYASTPNLNEWLAGLIDGDGCFLLSKKGYASLEITMVLKDEHALNIVKNIYGGSVRLRSGVKAIRYRLHNKEGLLKLINAVNGEIRNPTRLLQLEKICSKYSLTLKYPEFNSLMQPPKMVINNGWLSGIFDSDGTITINKANWKLSISVSQKTNVILEQLVSLYGGNIYIDRASNTFKWYVSSRKEIIALLEYFKKNPSRSSKKNRLHQVPDYYELLDSRAHKAPESTNLYKSWQYFYERWLES